MKEKENDEWKEPKIPKTKQPIQKKNKQNVISREIRKIEREVYQGFGSIKNAITRRLQEINQLNHGKVNTKHEQKEVIEIVETRPTDSPTQMLVPEL